MCWPMVLQNRLSGAGQKIQENAAMLAGMCLFTGFNYIGQRMFAFKE